jgi:hypothetical protein
LRAGDGLDAGESAAAAAGTPKHNPNATASIQPNRQRRMWWGSDFMTGVYAPIRRSTIPV